MTPPRHPGLPPTILDTSTPPRRSRFPHKTVTSQRTALPPTKTALPLSNLAPTPPPSKPPSTTISIMRMIFPQVAVTPFLTSQPTGALPARARTAAAPIRPTEKATPIPKSAALPSPSHSAQAKPLPSATPSTTTLRQSTSRVTTNIAPRPTIVSLSMSGATTINRTFLPATMAPSPFGTTIAMSTAARLAPVAPKPVSP